MRGYAPTDLAPDGDYSVRALATDAVALRWALAGNRPAVLAGHDWGAAAAYAVPPGVFDRVVAIAVPPPKVLATLPPRLAARQALLSWYMAFNQLPGVAERAQDRVVPRLWAAWSPGYDATEDLSHLRASWPTSAHRSAALAYYRALRPALLRQAGTADATFLHGEDDGCLLADVARRADGAVIVPGAGHFLPLERPEVVADYVAA
jgi:pimeloyl-ACP methyl ester carboxylesterase